MTNLNSRLIREIIEQKAEVSLSGIIPSKLIIDEDIFDLMFASKRMIMYDPIRYLGLDITFEENKLEVA